MHTRITKVLASVTFVLAVLSGLAFLGTAVTHMLDDGAVCVETDFWANASLADKVSTGQGVQESSSVTRLCQDGPSTGQRAAELGGVLPWLLFGSLALLLFSGLLKAVLREGPFTHAVSKRITVLGWSVAVGTPLAALVVGWSRSWLVDSMSPNVGSGPALEGPLVLVIPGLAAVIIGKFMADGVRMREDLEGTI
ncbi:Protein of unknown function (DUF2975) [Streptomyces sp. LamerLS-316]|uniref:DUF2975 domain-containing protein n=1 Tax=unclassified Streptomyces TaxID=2593676 RepID=UPI000823BE96|nr:MULTISPECIES: DUF2975 domain-containing protein [unclassified Streptomyces]MYQ43192.1 DUF2975 domain-containing protein [Streptomyces sp. SID4921]SCK35208.1 Protein of unknown function (DUF2975) [Streptomyces sp. LamerLS-316]